MHGGTGNNPDRGARLVVEQRQSGGDMQAISESSLFLSRFRPYPRSHLFCTWVIVVGIGAILSLLLLVAALAFSVDFGGDDSDEPPTSL